MTGLHKFRPKTILLTLITTAFSIAITLKSEARCATRHEIYSSLTSDTIPLLKKDADLLGRRRRDTTAVKDTTARQQVDTFHLRLSKDTLDAPVNYEASDSGVLLVKEKKFLLYGSTKTTYKDITVTAPKVELNQETSTMTAFNAKDSAGNVIARAHFLQGSDGFQADTIRYNFKNKKGITTNTFSQQGEGMFVHFDLSKKINDSVTFARHVTFTTCDYDVPHFGFVASKGQFITGKVAITGPIHPEFEGVPIPLYLPFGIFPLTNNRHSGLLPPQFTVNEEFGLGLEGLGYYHVLNDYLDVTVRTNLYSYGGWSASIVPTYRKRYKYSGSFNFSYQHTKFNFKGDPDFNLIKTFNISWSHSVDSRAKPGVTFSANVNAGSTRYNQYVTSNALRPFQNQLSSSISYSKTWQNKPFNLTLSANHNQNNVTHVINIILPDAGFTVTTFYPFERKEQIGTAKWYEKVGLGYSGVFRNQLSFVDTAKNSFKRIIDTLQWGAQHRFPISMSLPPLGPLLVAPFISYEQTWLTHRIRREWNPLAKKVDTISEAKGLFVDHQINFGIGINTAIYGMYTFKGSHIKAIRHVIRPTISFNYKPNLSKQYYDVIEQDTSHRKFPVAQFDGRNLFSSYGYGKFGGITFGVDNNLEMKVRGKKDTADRKIKLIDGYGFTSGYNFLQDSLRLLPFNLYLRTTLFEKVSLTAQALYNPYQTDSFGRDINKFAWQADHFSLGRLSSGSISMSTNFQSKPRDPKKATEKVPTRQITDPNLLSDERRMQDYMQRNPSEFVDFNIPWTLNLSYSLFFTQEFQYKNKYKTRISSNLNFNNSFSLTPKWNFTTSGYYDFNTGQLSMFTMSINRDMHCWQMAISVTPIGQTRYFNITISPKSSILQDLRVNRTRYFYAN